MTSLCFVLMPFDRKPDVVRERELVRYAEVLKRRLADARDRKDVAAGQA